MERAGDMGTEFRRMSTRGRLKASVAWLAGVVAFACSSPAGVEVQDLVRLEGYGGSELWGIGLVVGLAGTGDGGEILPVARPLARMLERGANPVPDLEELADSNSVALVSVTVALPEMGVKKGDRIDAQVQTLMGASSLEGGRLFITMLTGPLPGQGVYAMASGVVDLQGTTATSGVVPLGARMIEDVDKPVVSPDGTVVLNVLPRYASWAIADRIASNINQDVNGLAFEGEEIEPVARVRDERTVVVDIPDADLSRPSGFLSSMLTIVLDESLLDLPARVVINEREGSIVLTGDVTISPTVVSHRDLVVTTVTPEIPADELPPRIEDESSEVVATDAADDRGLAKAEDLLKALRKLDVPVGEQITIIKQLHRAGHLHGELIFE